MANPTTNFGWVMPTSTSLVTNLPADFNTFGQGVDTSMAQLKGGTTGQILSKTSATDMEFTWITPNPGDITGVTAGTGISGGGTSGDVTITNSMATAMTTKGDLVPATGSGTFSRLAIGTNGQVLTADSTAATGMKWNTSLVSPLTTKGDIWTYSTTDARLAVGTNGQTLVADNTAATGLKWATASSGGMTLISTTTLTGSTVTISSIPQTYNNLQLVITSFLPSVDGTALRMRFNANSTANQHAYADITSEGYAAIVFNRIFATLNTGSSDNALAAGFYTVDFPDYTNTVSWKTGYSYATDVDSNGVDAKVALNYLLTNQTAAISSIQLFPSSGTFTGTAKLYGVK